MRKTVFVHAAVWVSYLVLMLLIARLSYPEVSLPFWDNLVYIVSVTLPFYASSLGAPLLLRKKQFVGFVGATLALFGAFLGIQYGVESVHHFRPSPGPEATPFDPDFFFGYYSYVFGLYYVLGLGFWLAGDRIAREKTLREAERQKDRAEREALRTELALKTAELAFLKVQFNPHFLYNTLNYLYARALPLSDDLAQGILHLSDIMRYSLHDSPDNRVTLTEEITHLRKLIELYQARFSHQLHVYFRVEGQPEHRRILPLVLISFAENAFKHGNLTDADDPLLIHLSATADTIAFTIQNKKGRPDRVLSTRVGSQNVQRRLALAYADKHQLRISEDEHHYRCELIIREAP